MSCFPCFSSQRCRKSSSKRESCKEPKQPIAPGTKKPKSMADINNREETNNIDNGNVAAQTFTFRELASATKNFRQECLLGEGGFGRVYKGTLQGTGQVVAVKQLDRTGLQGNKEFLVEVLMLTSLHHPNLVNLIGYCADGDQRLLVYEYMAGGSLEDHVLEIMPERKPLDWSTRMKIAYGAAQGLEYLHDKANPSVIFRDLKSSNILLDENFNPKLSDFGLAKLGPMGEKMHVSSRVVGTYGYCAPEYARTGQLTMKSDVFSFGVVLLELITGRRAIDTTKPIEEQNLVSWAQKMFRDPKKFPDMADPLLNKHFPETSLNQAVAIAAMCLQEEASGRPFMSDVVSTLSFLSMVPQESITSLSAPTKHSKVKIENDSQIEDTVTSIDGDDDSSNNQDEDSENICQQTIIKANTCGTNSSLQISTRSQDESDFSSRKGNIISHNSSISSSCKGHKSLKEGSISSSRNIHMESQIGNGYLSDHNNRKSCVSNHKGSRRSNNKSSSIGRLSSMESESGIVSSGRSSSVGSREGSIYLSRSSSKGSENGSICLDANNNSDSGDESFSLNMKFSKNSLDGSVYSS